MDKSRIQIREADKNDLPAIMRLERSCFCDAWSEELMQDEIIHASTYVCILEADGEAIGFAFLWFGFAEAHITNFAVLPCQRRKGFASLLMEHIVEKTIEQKLQAMTLEVRVTNQEAKALYAKFGFESVGIRPHYYANGENAEIMWKYDLREKSAKIMR